jgi:hypothetical protein
MAIMEIIIVITIIAGVGGRGYMGLAITRFFSPEGPDWGCHDHFLDAYKLYLALFDILFPV